MIPIRPRYAHWWPRLLGVRAIVLYPYVLFSDPQSEVAETLWRHEMIHVRQVRKFGFFRFYGRYLAEYFWQRLRGRNAYQAYRNISFEREAYGLAGRIEFTEAEKKEMGLV